MINNTWTHFAKLNDIKRAALFLPLSRRHPLRNISILHKLASRIDFK